MANGFKGIDLNEIREREEELKRKKSHMRCVKLNRIVTTIRPFATIESEWSLKLTLTSLCHQIDILLNPHPTF